MADVFLSYKKTDRALVQALGDALVIEGFTVWWDHELETGDKWLERIYEEIDTARALVGLWTPNAVHNGHFVPGQDGKNYLYIEHKRAERGGAQKVVGALYDERALPSLYVGDQMADLTGWDGADRTHAGFRALVAALETRAMPPFAVGRVRDLERKAERAADDARRARMDADRLAADVQELTRERAALQDRADAVAQDLSVAEARLATSAGWEGRQEALRRSLAAAEQQVRVVEAALEKTRGDAAAAKRAHEEAAARATAAEAARAAAVRERNAAQEDAKGQRAAAAGARQEAEAARAVARWAWVPVGAVGAVGWGLAAVVGLSWAFRGGAPDLAPEPVAQALAPEARTAVPTAPGCGNGREDPGEMCDFGADNADDDPGGCTTRCTLPFAEVKAGSYVIGNDNDPGRDSDEPKAHSVASPGFAVATTETTLAQKRRWGPRVSGDDLPWVTVNWHDARAYCRALGDGVRLPSEAEWEVAARAGTPTPWACGADASCLEDYAWYDGNSGDRAHPVATKRANAFGLYDLAGNVYEWVEDCYVSDASAVARVTDTTKVVISKECPSRVFRGGGFWFWPEVLRAGSRNGLQPGNGHGDLGFRCVRGPAPQDVAPG